MIVVVFYRLRLVVGCRQCGGELVNSSVFSFTDMRSLLLSLSCLSFGHRMTGLLSKTMEGKPPANVGGGGWSKSEVTNFLHYVIPMNESDRSDSEEAEGHVRNLVQKFDAVVFRVMHGWMKRWVLLLHLVVFEVLVVELFADTFWQSSLP